MSSAAWAPIAEVDPELWAAMEAERHRRADEKIELIASENYVSAAVLEAQGSWLTNKYAEGLPGKRYYGGCEFVDIVERLARERALALFPGAEHVNVQPHSGAQANMAAYFAVLQPGDRILGMNLAHGGHLTHGSPVNFSGKLYEVHAYGVRRGRPSASTTTRSTQAAEVRPEGGRRRRRAYPRTSTSSGWRPSPTTSVRCCSWTWRTSRGSSPRGSTQPVPARRPRDDDDPQDPARAAGRHGVRRRELPDGVDRAGSRRSRGSWPGGGQDDVSRGSRAGR